MTLQVILVLGPQMGPESRSLSKAVTNQVVMWLLCLTTIIPALPVVAVKWTKQKGCLLGRFQLHIAVCHSQMFLQPISGIQLPSMCRGQIFWRARETVEISKISAPFLQPPLCMGGGGNPLWGCSRADSWVLGKL